MTVHCQVRSTSTELIGDYEPLGITVWHNPGGIANVLSLSKLIRLNKAKIEYNSNQDVFVATSVKTKEVFKFPRDDQGLYSYNQRDVDTRHVEIKAETHTGGTMLVSTVKDNMKKYTNRQIKRAIEARRLQQTIGNVSDSIFKDAITKGTITNCAVTIEDLAIARDIYGPNERSVVGKTTRNAPNEIIGMPTPVPSYVLEKHSNLTLQADILYVNGIPFLATVSNPVDYVTVQALSDEKDNTLKKSLDKVMNLYKARGFDITRIDADGQLESLKQYYGTVLNICAQNEHVGRIERKIRVIKERVRSESSRIPF